MDPIYAGQLDATLLLFAAATVAANTNGAALALNTSSLASQYAPGQGGVPRLALISIASVKLSAGTETYAFKVQDSPDGTNWYDRSATTTVAQEAMPNDGTGGAFVLGFFSRGYQCRLVITVGGTAPSIVLNNCYVLPTANTMQ